MVKALGPRRRYRRTVNIIEFEVDTRGRRVFDLTDRVRAFAADAGGDGLVNVFLPHATAGCSR